MDRAASSVARRRRIVALVDVDGVVALLGPREREETFDAVADGSPIRIAVAASSRPIDTRAAAAQRGDHVRANSLKLLEDNPMASPMTPDHPGWLNDGETVLTFCQAGFVDDGPSRRVR